MSRKLTEEEKITLFWDHALPSLDGCLIWTGAYITALPERGGLRYGSFWWKGKTVRAHRLAWQLANNKDPGKWDVLHSCNNTMCVYPGHLRLGTDVDNARDRWLAGTNTVSALTNEQIKEIRHRYAHENISLTSLALDYSVTGGALFCIVHGLTWKNLPCIPKEEWTRDNALHAGERNPNAKIRALQARAIRALHRRGHGATAMSRRYKLPLGLIEKIIWRQTWKHVK